MSETSGNTSGSMNPLKTPEPSAMSIPLSQASPDGMPWALRKTPEPSAMPIPVSQTAPDGTPWVS